MGVAAVALVVSLIGPTAYAVQTVATPHTGAIPSAGPTTGDGGPGGGFVGPAGQPSVRRAPGGGAGRLLSGSQSTEAITALLKQGADSDTWVAAAVGSNTASGYQLATEEPVLAVGGFNGSDPSPTLAEFQQYVADGEVPWFIASGGFGGGQMGGSNASSEIAAWVEANFTATTVDGVTLYDLSADT